MIREEREEQDRKELCGRLGSVGGRGAAGDGAEATVWARMGTDLRAELCDSIYWQWETSRGDTHTVYPTWEEVDIQRNSRAKPRDLFVALCETWHETVVFSSLIAPLHPPHLLHSSLFYMGVGVKAAFTRMWVFQIILSLSERNTLSSTVCSHKLLFITTPLKSQVEANYH